MQRLSSESSSLALVHSLGDIYFVCSKAFFLSLSFFGRYVPNRWGCLGAELLFAEVLLLVCIAFFTQWRVDFQAQWWTLWCRAPIPPTGLRYSFPEPLRVLATLNSQLSFSLGIVLNQGSCFSQGHTPYQGQLISNDQFMWVYVDPAILPWLKTTIKGHPSSRAFNGIGLYCNCNTAHLLLPSTASLTPFQVLLWREFHWTSCRQTSI